jgi:hypothetical protein
MGLEDATYNVNLRQFYPDRRTERRARNSVLAAYCASEGRCGALKRNSGLALAGNRRIGFSDRLMNYRLDLALSRRRI